MLNWLVGKGSKSKQSARSRELTDALKRQWQSEGYVVFPGFFGESEISAFRREVDRLWTAPSAAGDLVIDVLDGPLTGKRARMRDVPPETRHFSHKVNDLYLQSEACRDLNLNAELCGVMQELLGGEPVAINSLTFEKGSQQPFHFDTYYMPPPVQDKMVVTSICLEDQHANGGPLVYYPGSHTIPAYRFSHGALHAVPEEMPDATQYIEGELQRKHLSPETFVGRAGDVFFWHAQLYHGGSPLIDQSRTRRTLVTHYWRLDDMAGRDVVQLGAGRNYLRRPHQPVN